MCWSATLCMPESAGYRYRLRNEFCSRAVLFKLWQHSLVGPCHVLRDSHFSRKCFLTGLRLVGTRLASPRYANEPVSIGRRER